MARIVFDLDGTLIDSVADIHAAVADVLLANNVPPLDVPTIQSFIGNGLPHLVSLVIKRVGLDIERLEELSSQVLARYNEHSTHATGIYPGVRTALVRLKEDGHRFGLCTNKPEAPARAIVEALEIGPFECLVGGDTFPERKPHPRPLNETFSALGAGPMIYVGDSEVDAETAQRAGVPFLLYSEGYRKTEVSDIPHHGVFAHFDQLPDCVTRCVNTAYRAKP